MPDRTRKLAAILFTDIVNYTSMMGEDEQRAIEVLKRSRRLQKALVEQFHGEWVQEVGDGTLCTFGSAVDAVNCALELQRVLGDDADLKLRIGIHEGDIVVEGQDVYGDGVNVASRIHALASEGGICVSEKVYDEIRNKPGIQAASLGDKKLKNVDRPVKVYELRAPGLLASEVRTHSASWFHSARDSMKNHSAASSVLIALAIAIVGYTLYATNRVAIQTAFILNVPPLIARATSDQEIGFTTAKDGVRIAYATSGEGPAVVQVLGWFTHLEKGLSSPAFSMAPRWEKQFFFVRFDGRGTGLSDRGIEDYSLDARLSDLEAVVDALNLERFSIVAHSAGGPVAIAYA